jgi:predicted PurR-regulated permease PerM
MHNNKHHQLFFFFCLSVSVVLLFFVVRPLLAPLIMAGVFAFLFQPIYTKLTYWIKGRNSLSAFLVTALSAIIIIIPITFLGTMILKEVAGIYKNLADGGGVIEKIEGFISETKTSLPLLNYIDIDINKYVSQGLEALAQNIGSIFSRFAKFLLNLFIFLTAFYFLLKDGKKFGRYIVELSPLDDKDDFFIVSRLKSAVKATVKGNLTISLIQGILTGVGFFIFGVPNPVLWGGIAAITALIPGIGTALVLVPGIAYLFISGNTYSGIGLSVWGLTAVGLIDNLLGPRLVGQGMKLHPLAVFVSVIGGMAFFGPLGFIFGPLALSICIALVEIYFSLRKNNNL